MFCTTAVAAAAPREPSKVYSSQLKLSQENPESSKDERLPNSNISHGSNIDPTGFTTKLNDYFNGLFMFTGKFLHVTFYPNHRSSTESGEFYLWRDIPGAPAGKSPCQSDSPQQSYPRPPSGSLYIYSKTPTVEITAQEGVVQISTRGKTSRYSVDSVPFFKIFSKHPVDLRSECKAVRCDNDAHRASVTLKVGRNSEVVLSLFLYDNGNIKSIAGWTIKEPNRTVTTVAFLADSIQANSCEKSAPSP
jgi:hypothetical protein